MKEFYINLFKYNHWANERVIVSLKQIEGKNEKAFQIMSHIIDAQINWLKRIKDPANASQNFWNIYKLQDLKALSFKCTKDWTSFIETDKDNFKEKIKYINSKGIEFTNTTSEILTHVVNHSSYHRGQIALLMRNNWGTPAMTDYIVFERE